MIFASVRSSIDRSTLDLTSISPDCIQLHDGRPCNSLLLIHEYSDGKVYRNLHKVDSIEAASVDFPPVFSTC